MDINMILDSFLKFNQNGFYFILYFLKTYWAYMVVVGAIALSCSFEIKNVTAKFVKDERRII